MKEAQPTRTPLTGSDLLDIWLGQDARGAFMVSDKCRQLVEDFKALRAELEQVRQDLQKWERDIGLALQDRMDEQKLREASESREKKLKEALEKIAELKPTADNPFYALRTIRGIKEIARRALEGE